MRDVAAVLDADPVLSIAAFSYTKVAAVATGNADLKFRATAGRLYRIRRNPDDVRRTISEVSDRIAIVRLARKTR